MVDASQNLACGFEVRQVNAGNLPAEFARAPYPYEKMLTEYSLTDEDGDITRNKEYKITFDTMRRDAETYLVEDYGAGHFGDIEVYFDVNITDVVAGDITSGSISAIAAFSNVIGVMDDIAAGDVLFVAVQQNTDQDDQYGFYIRQYDAGVAQFIEGGSQNWHTTAEGTLYGVFSRKGTTVTLRMYSDAARETLLYTYSSNLAVLDTYRYIHALSNWGRDVDPADTQSGTLENLKLGGNQELGCAFEVGQGNRDLPAEFCVVPRAAVNFGTWTEVDAPGDLEVTCIRSAFNTMRRDSDSRLFDDYGVGYWRDFELNFTLNVSDAEAGDATDRNYIHLALVANSFGDWQDIVGGDVVTVFLDEVTSVDDQFNFGLMEKTAGVTDDVTEGAVNHGLGTYYCTLIRIRNVSITLNVYSDAARTTLIESINIASTGQSLRYAQVTTGLAAVGDPGDNITGYLELFFTSYTANLPGAFTVRRSESQNLACGFFVNQGSQELAGTLTVQQAASQDLAAGFKLPTIGISLREHKTGGVNPNWTFSKQTATILRATSTVAGLGNALMFFTVSRDYIHGKYIRIINWESDVTIGTWGNNVFIFDGEYNRASDVDFPSGAGQLLKGNGLLQTGLTHSGDFGPVTEEFQVDVSGAALDNVTILVRSRDAWNAHSGWAQFDQLEINSGVGGTGNLWREPLTDSITMEREGGIGDYGIISEGQPPLGANLAAGFNIRRSDSEDLAAEFSVGISSDSEDLPAGFSVILPFQDLAGEFVVRQAAAQDLAAGFDAQVSLNLAAEFIVRQPGSQDLGASFDGQVSLNLLTGFYVDDTHTITGITKDNAGNRLGNCEVALFRVEPGTPPTYTFIASGMSDALGDYTFTGLTKRRFFVRAQKDGAPNVYDTTDNELEPV